MNMKYIDSEKPITEIEIPEGYEARIEGNKVIIEHKDSEDEMVRKELIGHCKDLVRMNKDDKVLLSIYEPWLAYLEKQKEQKPVHKVSREEYVKRFKVLCDAYEINLPNREYDIYHLCDDLSKLSMDYGKQKPATEWTIENAQPGDILHTWSTANSDTFIFKEIDSDGLVKCYCSYDSEDGFREGEYHYIGNKDDKYTLATPEQCIELGRRMGRAGYLFDFKTKKLIRLGSKRELIEWNLEDENMLQFYLDECEYKHDHWPNKDRVEMLNKFKDWLVNRAKYFAKPKHEWTDDDNKMAEALHNCISELIDNNGWNYVYVDDDSISLSKIKDWIDKLRERV